MYKGGNPLRLYYYTGNSMLACSVFHARRSKLFIMLVHLHAFQSRHIDPEVFISVSPIGLLRSSWDCPSVRPLTSGHWAVLLRSSSWDGHYIQDPQNMTRSGTSLRHRGCPLSICSMQPPRPRGSSTVRTQRVITPSGG